MGADIRLYGRFIRVKGVERLRGAQVTATDLRGGAALVIGGLTAEGTTQIAEIEKSSEAMNGWRRRWRRWGGKFAARTRQNRLIFYALFFAPVPI